eukprot:jgi/Phyca11/557650/estExt2_Genewise1Plus.C_PHYCAscaffold_1960001
MIIRQQRTCTAPKAKHLHGLFWQSRRLADILHVESWAHHRRRYNRMADALANRAMDNKRSVQFSLSESESRATDWQCVFEHAANDIGHWQQNWNHESSSELEAFTP